MPTEVSQILLDASKPEEVEDKDKREIGGDAVWTLSTAKPGNGVEQIRQVCWLCQPISCCCLPLLVFMG